MEERTAFGWRAGGACEHHGDVLGPVVAGLRGAGARRVLDLGCGNGSLTAQLATAGFDVVGVEADADGVAISRANGVDCRHISVYDGPGDLGTFDAVVCVEVVEHLFRPGALPRFAAEVLRPGGTLIVTTPYHGYLKNLLIAVKDGWDDHLEPLHDGGHIKFFSRRTLEQLLADGGFTPVRFEGSGRAPLLWRSMVVTATRQP